jgi:anionic cell wall polymer biosynthesis LytR-Cps2A-Psr (LCP) family protein
VRQIIAYTLQIEIDYYVLIRMTAFNSLTDNVGGYNVKIPTAVKDPKFWDDPRGPQGIYFPSSTAWWLKGNNTALCNGYYKTGQLSKPGARCDRAIVYVRTRKGTGNSDFKRQRRAQDVVAAAIRKVGQRGNGSNLTALFNAALAQRNAGSIDTNIPVSLSSALDFYALLNSATLTQQAVFKPTTYASRITGTSAYQLKLTPVRNLTKLWFAPVK